MSGAVHDAVPTALATVTNTLATVAALATAAATQATAPPPHDAATGAGAAGAGGGGQGECRLLGSFALFVQLALGGLALMSLVYKRWRERPQRPLKIWFFDASKQVFGSVLVHIANVFMSMLTSGRFSVTVEPAAVAEAAALARRFAGAEGPAGEGYAPNPCSFYLLNLAIDTTVGIPILILLLRVWTWLVSYTAFGNPPESIKSGNYGSPPQAWWWLKQSLIYFCGLFGMKFCVLIIFVMFPWISRVGDWALRWTEGNERLQIVFVMMLFPLIMNALQYYIIDSFIKNQADTAGAEGRAESRPGSAGNAAYQRVASGEGDDDGGAGHRVLPLLPDADDESAVKARLRLQSSMASPVRAEYDPEVDGDRPVTGGSSKIGPDGILPKELLPKE